MNVDRLERLKAIMNSIKPSELDMGLWQNHCGTICCALGWATKDPDFRAEGLKLVNISPYYGGRNGYLAGADFFGMSLSESLCLFSPSSYPNGDKTEPTEVIARIDKLITDGYLDPRDYRY